MNQNLQSETGKIMSRRRNFIHAAGTAWCILRRFGWARLLKRIRLKLLQRAVRKIRPSDYAGMIYPGRRKLIRQARQASWMRNHCRFGIFYDGTGSSIQQLALLHDSLMRQSFPDWTLVVFGEFFSPMPEKTEAGPNGVGFPVAAMLADSRFTHFILVRPDTALAPDALFDFADFCQRHPETPFIYSDDARFEKSLKRPFHYHFKPDFSPVAFRSMNYIGFSWCIARSALMQLSELEGMPVPAVSSELIFRLMERRQNIGHLPEPLFGYRKNNTGTDPVLDSSRPVQEGLDALRSHFARLKIAAEAEPFRNYPVYRIRYQLNSEPLISILIPSRDQADMLKKCIDSILSRSSCRNFEIVILENGSSAPETAALYRKLERNSRIRLVRCPVSGPFNYAALNNYGIRFCRGEYVVFLNNDVEVVTPAWLEEMLMYAQQDDTGAVGAKLCFPDRTIQHGGVMVGFMGAAEHLFLSADPDRPGYAGQLLYARNCSAVTFACCMVRKSLFEQIGGLDEEFALSFNDVDFCLRLLARGLQIVWTPFAELIHYESRSRGYDDSPEKSFRLQQEICRLQRKWHDFLLKGDPFYNPHLSLVSLRFDFRHPAENRLIQSLLDDFGRT